MTGMSYERVYTDDLNFDPNPNAGGGLRLFPDARIPGDQSVHRRLRVKAQYGESTSNNRIYFRTIDLDDPSANSAPVDAEPSAGVNTGNDNRGNVDGTPATKAGLLSIPNPNTYQCQAFTEGAISGISCLTDPNGVATVDFTTTMNPGDNFTVAASANQTYLANLILAADGINLQDAQSPPVITPISTACSATQVRACRTDMLTIWRRLHIEVDTMGQVTTNHISGTILDAIPSVGTTQLFIDSELEDYRFEPGTIDIVGEGDLNVLTSVSNTVLVDKELVPEKVIGSSFTLYDDDDYDNDDPKNNGDENETSILTLNALSKMQTSDVASENVYKQAYIMPIYDGGGNINNNGSASFVLNLPNGDVQSQVTGAVVGSSGNEADNFWVAYIQIGYQPAIFNDKDPDRDVGLNDETTTGATPAYTADTIPANCSNMPFGGPGSAIYQETIRDLFGAYGVPDDLLTVPHEVGHQFGLKGDVPGFELMGASTYNQPTFVPAHLHILRCRVKSPGT